MKAAGLNPGFVAAGDLRDRNGFYAGEKRAGGRAPRDFQYCRTNQTTSGVHAVGVGTMLPYGNFTQSRAGDVDARDVVERSEGTGSGRDRALYRDHAGIFRSDRREDSCGAASSARLNARTKMHGGSRSLMKNWRRNCFRTKRRLASICATPFRRGTARLTTLKSSVSSTLTGMTCRTTPPSPGSFVPFAQGYSGNVFLHARLNTQSRQAVAGMTTTMRSMLREVDPGLPVLGIAPFVDLMDKSVGLWIVKLGATLFGAFGGIALLLAVVGVYGVKAYAVACRTREIGIRMALGAHRRDVFALIMRQGAMQTALAVLVGLLLSLGAGRCTRESFTRSARPIRLPWSRRVSSSRPRRCWPVSCPRVARPRSIR